MTARQRRRVEDLNKLRRKLREEFGPHWRDAVGAKLAKRPDWESVALHLETADGEEIELVLTCRPEWVPDEPFDPFA